MCWSNNSPFSSLFFCKLLSRSFLRHFHFAVPRREKGSREIVTLGTLHSISQPSVNHFPCRLSILLLFNKDSSVNHEGLAAKQRKSTKWEDGKRSSGFTAWKRGSWTFGLAHHFNPLHRHFESRYCCSLYFQRTHKNCQCWKLRKSEQKFTSLCASSIEKKCLESELFRWQEIILFDLWHTIYPMVKIRRHPFCSKLITEFLLFFDFSVRRK